MPTGRDREREQEREREREKQREPLRRWLEAHLGGRSMRDLSRAVLGAQGGDRVDETWLQAVLKGRRALPTPDECRVIADELNVPLIDVLQQVWGVDRARIAQELDVLAARPDLGTRLDELDSDELGEVENFVGYLLAKREQGRRTGSNGAGD